jgi:hypothetical protein
MATAKVSAPCGFGATEADSYLIKSLFHAEANSDKSESVYWLKALSKH